jgi:hypothetical protein
LSSVFRSGAILLSLASLCGAAELLWEPGKVVSVEQVSTPEKAPDPSCRAVPKGAATPARCRASNLDAEQFWRVTVDVGNKRLVVRPYRAQGLLNSLNQAATVYVDPNLSASSPVEVAVVSGKAVRLRADKGQGIPAILDSQELLSTPPSPEISLKSESSAPLRPKAAASHTSSSKVVLLENSDFIDMEALEIRSQDIGDGAVAYSFAGEASPTRPGSKRPVFLVLAEGDAAAGGDPEVSRLQVGKGTRQMAYSLTKGHSASSVPIGVTQVSATLRKIAIRQPLPPGEYVVLLQNSNRGFLFSVR